MRLHKVVWKLEERAAGRDPADAPGTATTPIPRPNDPDYRRLHYIRYADDWLLGYTGTRREAEDIKGEIGRFLGYRLKLELSEHKTLITHGRTESARFLGYEIVVHNNDAKHDRNGHRSINGQIGLKMPMDAEDGHQIPGHRLDPARATPMLPGQRRTPRQEAVDRQVRWNTATTATQRGPDRPQTLPGHRPR